MKILGLSAFYHESACCLLVDGELVAAVAEERLTRVKHDPRLPVRAFRACLETAGLTPADLDAVAYYESPEKKLERQLAAGRPVAEEERELLDPRRPLRAIREHLGFEGPVLTFEHHLSHAASAYFCSGFDDAAVLTVDGVGEWATTSYGRARGAELTLFEEVRFPHSLGLLYAALTAYLGFRVNSGEYKVMGLAPYGRPRFVEAIRRLVRSGPGGELTLDLDYFDFVRGESMVSPRLSKLLGRPPRRPGSPLEPFHQDVARSLQAVLEEVLLDKVRYLAGRVDSPNLCLAGGVALNCVAVGRIRREGPFAELFVQPAAGDAGACLGAAALAHLRLTGRRPAIGPLTHVFFGPPHSPAAVERLLAAADLPAHDFRGREAELVGSVAARLAAGEVVGWFCGRMEFGPRALGGRSILASPLDPGMRDRINRHVKRREAFRPFAPSVLAADAADWFELDRPSPFMLETCRVRSPRALPATTHVDGSARPQTVDPATAPRFAALLEAFRRRTGYPVLLNTSLNLRGEPIVATPADALVCAARAGLDALVLDDWVVEREMLPTGLGELLEAWQTRPRPALGDGESRSTIGESLYTFV